MSDVDIEDLIAVVLALAVLLVGAAIDLFDGPPPDDPQQQQPGSLRP